MILARNVRLKIVADAFSLWENRYCLSAFDIPKNLPKSLRLAWKSFEIIRLSCLWYDFNMIWLFEVFLAYLLVVVLAVFSPSRESDG